MLLNYRVKKDDFTPFKKKIQIKKSDIYYFFLKKNSFSLYLLLILPIEIVLRVILRIQYFLQWLI